MNYRIRPATPDDADLACAVVRRSIQECCHEDHQSDPRLLASWLSNKTSENLRSWFASRGYPAVAEVDGNIVGVGMLGSNGKIALCYLLPDARFRGIGKALLHALEAEAVRRGVRQIELESTKTARRFYERNGYSECGTEQNPLGLTAHRMFKVIQ